MPYTYYPRRSVFLFLENRQTTAKSLSVSNVLVLCTTNYISDEEKNAICIDLFSSNVFNMYGMTELHNYRGFRIFYGLIDGVGDIRPSCIIAD